MDNPQTFNVDTWADAVLRYDGPHDPQAIVDAAEAIRELTRRIANATRTSRSLQYPSQVYEVLGGLRPALGSLQQILNQLGDRMEQLADDQNVTIAGRTRGEAREAAYDAANALRRSGTFVREVAHGVDVAHRRTGPLEYRDA